MRTEIDRQQTHSAPRRTLDDVFVEHYKFLFRAAKAILKRADEASDVVQELYLRSVQRELSCGAMENAKAYLHRAAVNLALDWKRSRKSRKEDVGVDKLEIQDTATGRAHDNVRDTLEELFSRIKLKPEVLQILILHHIEGYSDAEIAGMLGETRSKIAAILSRTHAKLRNDKEV